MKEENTLNEDSSQTVAILQNQIVGDLEKYSLNRMVLAYIIISDESHTI